jgi:hypothetical protein
MVSVAVLMFKPFKPVAEVYNAAKPRFVEQFKRPRYCRIADIFMFLFYNIVQLLGVYMLLGFQEYPGYLRPLSGATKPFLAQKLYKSIFCIHYDA